MAKKGAPRRKRPSLCSALKSQAEFALKRFRAARKAEKACAAKPSGNKCDLSLKKAITQEAREAFHTEAGRIEDNCGNATISKVRVMAMKTRVYQK